MRINSRNEINSLENNKAKYRVVKINFLMQGFV